MFFANFVFLFMIISGFSMCCGYYEKISNRKITLSRFYEKRYAKIWPFFAILVLMDIIMNPSMSTIIEGFADLTLAFALLPNPNISVIGVGWTLGVIFVFYMLFPFFCFLLDDKRRAWFVFLVTIVLNYMCNIYFMDANHVLTDNFNLRWNFLYCSMYFMSGGLIYLYRNILRDFVKRFPVMSLILCLVVTIVYFIANKNFFGDNGIEIRMMILFSLWLIYAIGSNGIVLNNSFVRFISSISMEIYLCHMVIFRIIERAHMNYLFGMGMLSYIITTALVLIGAILFSLLIRQLIHLVFYRK